MKNSRFVALLAFVPLFFATLQLAAAEPLTIRVLSYNIHHGEGVDGVLDLARIGGVIKSVKPDLVALQEVDRNASRSGTACGHPHGRQSRGEWSG